MNYILLVCFVVSGPLNIFLKKHIIDAPINFAHLGTDSGRLAPNPFIDNIAITVPTGTQMDL
jgi:hypothetical protein